MFSFFMRMSAREAEQQMVIEAIRGISYEIVIDAVDGNDVDYPGSELDSGTGGETSDTSQE
jgi:hypothetical protein